ncbi:hypothetical protein NLG97_g6151 [Lecanicillium saksenae]|uniref:Uncharacterized protein n=1 Tax=Lecanicillium saksenae TaxID=468837 RepID=A0ACC1QS52_9HYPO|nr:hypothetical protein NLG97_g6151 [Lecanicillium saksenae]
MPTATKYLGFELHNLGPATTAFSVPAACATSHPFTVVEVGQDGTRRLDAPVTCRDPIYDGCIPNGREWDRAYKNLRASPHNGNVLYRSPGISCPSGWTTAATIVGGPSGATGASGIFTAAQASGDASGGPVMVPLIDAYVKPLDPGETLVFCCPESYTAGTDVLCISTLGAASSLHISSLCFEAVPSDNIKTVSVIDGTTLSREQIIITGTNTDYSTTIMAAPSGTDVSAVTITPGVALVHQQSDLKGGGGGGYASSTSGSGHRNMGTQHKPSQIGTNLIVWIVYFAIHNIKSYEMPLHSSLL